MPLENYTFHARDGAFDTKKIEEHLASLDYVIRDPARTDLVRYLVCEDVHLTSFIHRRRLEEPKRRWPVGIVDVWPDRVEVGQFCDYDTMRLVRDFVRWLTTTFLCTIIDERSKEHAEMDTLFPDDLDTR